MVYAILYLLQFCKWLICTLVSLRVVQSIEGFICNKSNGKCLDQKYYSSVCCVNRDFQMLICPNKEQLPSDHVNFEFYLFIYLLFHSFFTVTLDERSPSLAIQSSGQATPSEVIIITVESRNGQFRVSLGDKGGIVSMITKFKFQINIKCYTTLHYTALQTSTLHYTVLQTATLHFTIYMFVFVLLLII